VSEATCRARKLSVCGLAVKRLAREGERDRIQPGRVDRGDARWARIKVEEQPAVLRVT